MDVKSAARFKQPAERVIEELSLALTLAKEAAPTHEFLRLRTSVGDIIARVDTSGPASSALVNDVAAIQC